MNIAYNVDCMEYMRTLPDKAFDLAVVDPPYRDADENAPTKDMRRNGSLACFGDKPSEEYFAELKRVSKEQIVWGPITSDCPRTKGLLCGKS